MYEEHISASSAKKPLTTERMLVICNQATNHIIFTMYVRSKPTVGLPPNT